MKGKLEELQEEAKKLQEMQARDLPPRRPPPAAATRPALALALASAPI
jgi:hypothetical protein